MQSLPTWLPLAICTLGVAQQVIAGGRELRAVTGAWLLEKYIGDALQGTYIDPNP